MNYSPFISYTDLLQQVATPPADAPVPTATMLKDMEQWLASFKGKRDLRRNMRTALRQFRTYAAAHPHVQLTDALPAQLQPRPATDPASRSRKRHYNILTGPLRQLINGGGMRAGWLRRPLLDWRQTRRAARLLRLAPQTLKMLTCFENRSRQVAAE